MKRCRLLVLLVLLLTVPFQAAVGSSGMCATMSHHGQSTPMEAHDHGQAPVPDHHHAQAKPVGDHHATMSAGDHHKSPSADAENAPDTSGKCKTCNECCSAAASVSAVAPAVFSPDTPLRVSGVVDLAFVSRAGDGLFRPPRTSSLQ